jgi:hypothetical protein
MRTNPGGWIWMISMKKERNPFTLLRSFHPGPPSLPTSQHTPAGTPTLPLRRSILPPWITVTDPIAAATTTTTTPTPNRATTRSASRLRREGDEPGKTGTLGAAVVGVALNRFANGPRQAGR